MQILKAIKSGALRSVSTWKGVLIIWFSLLLLISLLVIPMKGALRSGLGNSMITEKLADGINIEVFAELGQVFSSLISFFASGFLLVLLAGFLLNVFFAGGLFGTLRGASGKFLSSEFFKASARNFWSFMVISLILSLIIMTLLFIIVGIPLGIVSQSQTASEGSMQTAVKITGLIFLLLLPILLLVADYSRAWQVSADHPACFKAIGYGFSRTFKTFLTSYPLMIIVLLIQILFGWFVLTVIPGLRPASGIGVFLLFLLTQLLFVIKILLRAWRYGSVTALMEQNPKRL